MKELIFNDLTATPLASDLNERVKQFIAIYKEKPSLFEERIRLETYIGELQLTNDMSLQEFCNATPQCRTLGSLLLGLGKHFFIDENTHEESLYLKNSYVLIYNGNKRESIGLAAAYLYDTICIGFESEDYWKGVAHQIVVSNNGKEICTPSVLSVSAPEHFKSRTLEEWLELNRLSPQTKNL